MVALDSVMIESEETVINARVQIHMIADNWGVPVLIVLNNGVKGPGPARNITLSYLEAPYMLVVDSDDLICSQGVISMLDALESNKDIGWAAGRAPHIDLEENVLWMGPEDYFKEGIIETSNSFWEAKLELGGIAFLGNSTLARTEVVKAVGGWPSRIRRRAEDTALWAVLGSQYRGYWVPEDVYLYRRHPNSVTHQPGFRELDEGLDEIREMIKAGTTQI